MFRTREVPGGWEIACPGCNVRHALPADLVSFSGSRELPTFEPDMLVRRPPPPEPEFPVKDGVTLQSVPRGFLEARTRPHGGLAAHLDKNAGLTVNQILAIIYSAKGDGAPPKRDHAKSEAYLAEMVRFYQEGREWVVCHFTVTNGVITFLPDTNHALRGNAVLLPIVEDAWPEPAVSL